MTINSDIVKIANKNKKANLSYNLIRLKLIEEMAELTQALLKDDSDNIIEESADVYIVLNQLATTINQYEFEKMVDYKINRTKEFLGIKEE